MAMDKEYFDAKFEGLEKLMRSDKENMLAYVGAVSKNAAKAVDGLAAHEKDQSAHGADAADRKGGGIVQWLGLLLATLAAVAAVIPLVRK